MQVTMTKLMTSHSGTVISSVEWQDLDCFTGCQKCTIPEMHGKCLGPAKYGEWTAGIPSNGPFINSTDSTKGIPIIDIAAHNATEECAHGMC